MVDRRLRICAEAKPAWFDAHNQIAGAARILAPNIVPGILGIGDNLAPAPSLAQAWVWEDDRTLRLDLAHDRRFSSGRPVSPQAVIENLERPMAERGSVFNAHEFSVIGECSAVSESSLVLRLKQPFAPLPGVLANGFGIVDLHQGLPPQNTQGTGPFEIRLSSARGLSLVARDNPATHVEWAFCTGAAARRRRIRAEQADVLIGDVGAAFAETQGWTIHATEGGGPIHLTFNLRRWPGNKLIFRQRVAEAVDRDEVVRAGFRGHGQTGESPFPPSSTFYISPKATRSSNAPLERLAGRLPSLELAVGGAAYLPAARVVAKAIERLLRIRVQVVSIANPIWWPSYYLGGTWDLAIQAWTPMPDPHLVYDRRYASWGIHNAPGYANERLDRLIEAAATSLDLRTRLAYYAEAEQIRLNDCPTVYLGFPDRVLSARPGAPAPTVKRSWEVELQT